MLVSLDGVPSELRAMYRLDDDGVYTLTDVARANIRKIADGIQQLGRLRDQAAEAAKAAAVSAQVMGAVLIAGAQGVMAAGACAQYEAEHVISMRDGVPVVGTPAGEVDLKSAVADWMAGAGSIFLSNDYSRQLRRVNS
jgi:hypothetical protein